ncbi:ABC transporter substrate-binding protein [Achromobacter sp. HZ28]|nr:ABC transporter substrate-binding protein [Achromobacter sp. HZ28]OWT81017.1 ABC transporter substrate-binding protein [Achromobacter sp. HZ34]
MQKNNSGDAALNTTFFNPHLAARQRVLTAVLAGTALLAGMVPGPAEAADAPYPNHPVTLVVPYPAGGSGDVLARILADGLGSRYKRAVVVENRSGVGGHIGAEYALRQPHDGYTLILATIAHNSAYAMYGKLHYNPPKDLVPVALFAESPNVLMVPATSPYKSVQDILAAARAHPGKLNYASAGVGSGTHMAAELFKYLAKVDITGIPFRGGAPAMTALMSGDVDLDFETGATANQAIASGKVRALAVTSAQPSPSFPGLPTVAANGVPDYSMTLSYTISVANGVPQQIIDKLNADINDIVKSPEYAKRLNAAGMEAVVSTPASARERNEREAVEWTKVIQAAHIQLD